MDGWIKIHRKILEHWLYNEYRPLTKREAWENILLWANYYESKVLIKGQLIECKRGQLLYSIETYAQKFCWSVGQVRNFFELLKKDGMIKVEGLKYTTRLTICNYDIYQDEQRTDNELTTNSQQPDNELTTNSQQQEKNNKNNKKEKNIYTDDSILIFDFSKDFFDKKYLNETTKKIFQDLLKNYSVDDIKKAITFAKNDNFWSSNFLSPAKLVKKNKENVTYIDVFLSKSKTIKLTNTSDYFKQNHDSSY